MKKLLIEVGANKIASKCKLDGSLQQLMSRNDVESDSQ